MDLGEKIGNGRRWLIGDRQGCQTCASSLGEIKIQYFFFFLEREKTEKTLKKKKTLSRKLRLVNEVFT